MTQGPGGRAAPEPEAPTTFCALLPRMPQWKFASPGGFLGRGPAAARAAGAADAQPEPGVPALAAVLGACEPRCAAPCPLPALSRCRGSGTRGTRGTPDVADEWARKGGFIHKPAHGWLHPDARVLGPGVSYIVRYMGCIEVLRSMRSLDFNTRTQVTREAINRLHEAVPGVRGSWKKKASNKALASILGKSNLRFAGMSISVNISVDGLNLSVPATRQIIANHHMQSISFASGGDSDMTDYVAYVAKDPINQRACHILECCEGLAQSIISTVGQAFELRFKQYLHSPPKAVMPPERLTGLEESAWGDGDEALDHNYYNSIPGKEPPLGGLVDSRLAVTQPCALATLGGPGQRAALLLQHLGSGLSLHVRLASLPSWSTVQLFAPARSLGWPLWSDTGGVPVHSCLPLGLVSFTVLAPLSKPSGFPLTCHPPSFPVLPGDGYVQADARGPRDYEEHLYVNTQGLDAIEPEDISEAPLMPEDSPKKDLFDMRPFEDALKLHECSVAASITSVPFPLEDQWPSPPTRRAPIAPTEEQLRQEPWYHGRMSRRAAEKLLRADGDFLVRDSITNPGQYVLTGMHAGQPKHLLLVDPEGVVRTKDVLFESISHLIDYHLKNGLPIVAAESELHLRGVVSREP
ncbi:SHC (Src homology 2 domain containing) transforming protein 2 [Cricetulus griseus]